MVRIKLNINEAVAQEAAWRSLDLWRWMTDHDVPRKFARRAERLNEALLIWHAQERVEQRRLEKQAIRQAVSAERPSP